ncbi:NAD(P)H-binding protein [Streptomyces sp. NPDC005438]|uniref:NAD(P)-dependent oxidoreductase n=1 Tax=Streptomyces sp. NPDC005438 TaxID=3156880 RepID=UPI0033A99460
MADIVIFGAGGRAGRAATTEARARGHRVTAVVRDPDRHPDLAEPGQGVRVVSGDITDPAQVARAAHAHHAAVHAVSPFSGPEQGFADLDPAFFVRAAEALLYGLARAGVPRLLVVGLFANLRDPDGRPLSEDPHMLPPGIRPFAEAHQAGLDRLRSAPTEVDWLMVTPPARLEAGAPRTGGYRVGGETVGDEATARLSYADLAVALLDEIDTPRHHRTRISVHG